MKLDLILISHLSLDKVCNQERVIMARIWYLIKANSVQEACIKCLAVHTLKFEILKPAWKTISNFNMWTAKHLTLGFWTELVLQLKSIETTSHFRNIIVDWAWFRPLIWIVAEWSHFKSISRYLSFWRCERPGSQKIIFWVLIFW